MVHRFQLNVTSKNRLLMVIVFAVAFDVLHLSLHTDVTKGMVFGTGILAVSVFYNVRELKNLGAAILSSLGFIVFQVVIACR